MMKSIAIIGASGHGKVVADIAVANGFDRIELYDDRWPEIINLGSHPVVGKVDDAFNFERNYDQLIVAIGNSKTRAALQNKLPKSFPALIHPSTLIGSNVKIDEGTVIMPGAIINSDVSIGKGVIINSGAVVEHDCFIGDFAHISPNATIAGGVHIGKYSWVGIGAAVIQMVRIGNYVTVGAGAVVIKNVENEQTVVGNPAAVLKS